VVRDSETTARPRETAEHMISRAAQKTGVPFLGTVAWPGERDDEE
jgi:multicomponent Na+:H+ antiporter subunit G